MLDVWKDKQQWRIGGAAAVMVAIALPWSAARVYAQIPTADMATIEGSVIDPDNRAIANAAVVVRNVLTGDVRAAATDSGGRFLIDLLIVGKYDVEASAPGFSTDRRGEVEISAGGSRTATTT